ncbi:dihydrolipoamide acetyltransferase component of pyruvate dehydrogenase complex [Nocardioides psychrotolerans]|uniref:Dihydrolipoamide acetyltransferase component of pyruvate dehydrogenase complex n=1 Tax=Nocardioides psychrotolerans TaxID=1005945 RepID=A0A1I3EA38_9ACTN|nr:dihydrolipoamide acetyltransferase family protein [Nocardioides psychrotolerans]GEP37455.1 dihydrolipoamide acetyltransferase component of pyruvate dehydrogenase complex [Nocardioides psychrotolerans]SFH95749.1 pyruvate dehydrogenase E2 component (dihydrolipoamide acetyltransferase) [Nocardioides psychrotolerans]
MSEFLLPDVGEGLIEAEIVTWKVKVGDVVAINDIVVEIETAKSLVELPSPFEGEVTALMVAEGDTVSVGTPIIAIGAPAPAAPAEMEIDLSNPAASGRVEGESLVGRNKAERGPQRRARKGSVSPSSEAAANTQMQLQGAFAPGGAQSQDVAPADEPAVPAVPAVEPEPVSEFVPARALSTGEVRVLAKPPVRKLAKDLGIDLARLRATGPGGTVTRADVEGAASSNGNGPSVATGSSSAARTSRGGTTSLHETREPIKGVRKMMASAMVGSAFSAPHVTEWVTLDVTRTMELVERLKARRELREVKVSPLLVLARAVMLAMRRTPEINSFWDEPAQEVVLKHYVNLGIAAATPRGLVVPNIKDAQDLTLLELAGELAQLTATAREGRTQPAEMSGGTFTITNVGVFGVDAGTPIINPGESAILCFGAIKKQPWVVTTDGVDEIVVRQVTTLALSFDHRHIDGEKGSRFLSDVAGILEDPASALLF